MPSRWVGVDIEGARRLRADLRKAQDVEGLAALQQAYEDVADQVARTVAQVIPIGPTVNGHARDHVDGDATKTKARVRVKRRDVPYYGWLDFGTRTPRTRASFERDAPLLQSTKHGRRNVARHNRVGFAPWRATGKGPEGGRYLYPTIGRLRPFIADRARAAFEDYLDDLDLLE